VPPDRGRLSSLHDATDEALNVADAGEPGAQVIAKAKSFLRSHPQHRAFL